MKKTTLPFLAFIAVFLFSIAVVISCSNKNADNATDEHHHTEDDTTHSHDSTPMDSTRTVYACPMHPEITGKDGDTCSKCGMKLEAVKN